jgi:NAD(P)-dependent dehydrogenase (short-subunit alcohol dehydrogenase family)
VNSILAGPTRSEGVEVFVEQLAVQQKVERGHIEREFFASARPTSLLQRFATPEEVASLVVFVAGVPASAVNGAALRVDGGVVRSIV